jgi:two-component system phosphate regulon sensor histidine kinase PhoR
MLDFDATVSIGRPLYEMTRVPAVQALLDKAIRSGQAQREDIEFKKPDYRQLRVFVAPLADTPGAVMVLDDTSELRRLERLRHEFVANVSHELKTPLAVLKACVETLQDGAVEDPAIRGSFLQQIAEGADRLHALILDLLSLARIESGDEVLEYEAVPVADAVKGCLDRLRPRAEAKGMILEAVPPPESLEVWADDEAFGQIIDNLVDNAVKYTQAGGIVRVRWAAKDGQVCLSVEDNGPGIPERDLTRIFERFYRVDKARSRELGGTGLGLSIVKHLTQTLHGTVTATSQIGEGSTFTLCLPRPQ